MRDSIYQIKVLFISSGKRYGEPSPIVKSQGDSLIDSFINIDYYTIRNKGFIGYFKEIWLIRDHIKTHKYNIIHAHYGLTAIVTLFARNGQKLVASFMGDDLIGTNRFDGSIKFSSILLSRFTSILSKWFFDYSIVKSAEMRDRLSQSRVSIIPNGVNLNRFHEINKDISRKRLELCRSDTIVIFVSDPMRSEKNYNLAERAINRIVDKNIRLIPVFGIAQSELVYYYNAADVLIFTSFHEGSPNVIKEAMSCNCPIVSTNVGDVEWILGNTEGCYLTSFSEDDVAEKLMTAIIFTKMKGRTNGRERIIQLGLDSVSVANRIKEIYKRIIE
jgi:teichuronic acid biosynthesis glycosyltransferase TuaC